MAFLRDISTLTLKNIVDYKLSLKQAIDLLNSGEFTSLAAIVRIYIVPRSTLLRRVRN